MSSMIGDSVMDFALNGVIRECDGNRHAEMAPHGVYACADGEWISIAVCSDAQWRNMAEEMGRPELATASSFATHADRKSHEVELERIVTAWTAGCNALELSERLQARGIAAARSQSSLDLVSDPHLWSRGFYREVSDQAGQSRSVLGPPWKMSREAAITASAPRLGEHNDYVFGEILGLSTARQRELAENGITR
jgi:crotonobetainyl-CoA:carnitine CoA-transferase CaiB-like acyl-CoA transferase